MTESYYDVLTAAINELSETGYDSAARVAYWTARLRDAAERTMRPQDQMERMLRETLTATYRKLVDDGGVLRYNPGVPRFTIERLRPALRAALDRRILASASLITLNKKAAVEKTLQRLQGWATSIPAGGSDSVEKQKSKTAIQKSMRQLPFEERRVIIDQGHKLRTSISHVLAVDGSAIGGVWHSRYRQAGYDYREDHRERDSHFFMLRDNWAQQKGLVKRGPDGYVDDQTEPAEEPFCRCWYEWKYQLRDVPDVCVTQKGRDALFEARRKIAEMT